MLLPVKNITGDNRIFLLESSFIKVVYPEDPSSPFRSVEDSSGLMWRIAPEDLDAFIQENTPATSGEPPE